MCSGQMVLSTVRKMGLEPTRPKAQEPKSCVSTNSTTPARRNYSRCAIWLGDSGAPPGRVMDNPNVARHAVMCVPSTAESTDVYGDQAGAR